MDRLVARNLHRQFVLNLLVNIILIKISELASDFEIFLNI
jgi:hypothetical protein